MQTEILTTNRNQNKKFVIVVLSLIYWTFIVQYIWIAKICLWLYKFVSFKMLSVLYRGQPDEIFAHMRFFYGFNSCSLISKRTDWGFYKLVSFSSVKIL